MVLRAFFLRGGPIVLCVYSVSSNGRTVHGHLFSV